PPRRMGEEHDRHHHRHQAAGRGGGAVTVRAATEWQPTACILCECNCGIEVRLGGEDGRRFERIRGDKAHPASQGYTCEKALRLDHYQNGRHRLTTPMRRRPDGTYEPVDWETAIAEVAAGLARVRHLRGLDDSLLRRRRPGETTRWRLRGR